MKKVIVTAIVTALVTSVSTATATSFINGRSIKPGSIPANRLTKAARASFHTNSVGAPGPQGPQGPKGDTGATGPAGPQGPPGNSQITVIHSAPILVGYGNNATAYVECPTGDVVLGGGVQAQNISDLQGGNGYTTWFQDSMTGRQGWEAIWLGTSGGPGWTTVYAICSPAAS